MAPLKVAILGEDESDEVVTRILVDALLGEATESVPHPAFQTRGWQAALRQLSSLLRHLEFRTDANTLVVVLDSDESAIHIREHESDLTGSEGRRACEALRIHSAFEKARRLETGSPPRLKLAVGLAVPATEAWLLYGMNAHVGEAGWALRLSGERVPYSKLSLKEQAYGSTRAGRSTVAERARDHVHRIARDLDGLTDYVPGGFGVLTRTVRALQQR